MNRIIWHHTGGGYTPNDIDCKAYHRLIDGEGRVHDGLHPISANAPGRALKAGQYAAHCLGLNSGSIGLSICAMAGAVWAAPNGKTPVRPTQIAALVAETAKLCKDYKIEVTPRTVLSHAEVEITLGIQQRNKWDFDYDPTGESPRRDPIAIGNALRAQVIRTLGNVPAAPQSDRPTLRRGDKGPFVAEMQQLLGGLRADGSFGPRTWSAVAAFQRKRQLLPDGVVGPMTWAALLGE